MGNKVGKEVKVERITVRIKEFVSDGTGRRHRLID